MESGESRLIFGFFIPLLLCCQIYCIVGYHGLSRTDPAEVVERIVLDPEPLITLPTSSECCKFISQDIITLYYSINCKILNPVWDNDDSQ